MTPAEVEELRLLAEQIGNAAAAGLIDPEDDEARIARMVDKLLCDAPAIHAAGVQEGRAAMLREVVEFMRHSPSAARALWEAEHTPGCGFNDRENAAARTVLADAIEARFPSEGTT